MKDRAKLIMNDFFDNQSADDLFCMNYIDHVLKVFNYVSNVARGEEEYSSKKMEELRIQIKNSPSPEKLLHLFSKATMIVNSLKDEK